MSVFIPSHDLIHVTKRVKIVQVAWFRQQLKDFLTTGRQRSFVAHVLHFFPGVESFFCHGFSFRAFNGRAHLVYWWDFCVPPHDVLS